MLDGTKYPKYPKHYILDVLDVLDGTKYSKYPKHLTMMRYTRPIYNYSHTICLIVIYLRINNITSNKYLI